jgi:hypothetical protein
MHKCQVKLSCVSNIDTLIFKLAGVDCLTHPLEREAAFDWQGVRTVLMVFTGPCDLIIGVEPKGPLALIFF